MADEKGSGFTPEKASVQPVKPSIEGTRPPVVGPEVTRDLEAGREKNPLGTLKVLAEDPNALGNGAEIPEKPAKRSEETSSPRTSDNEQKSGDKQKIADTIQKPEQKMAEKTSEQAPLTPEQVREKFWQDLANLKNSKNGQEYKREDEEFAKIFPQDVLQAFAESGIREWTLKFEPGMPETDINKKVMRDGADRLRFLLKNWSARFRIEGYGEEKEGEGIEVGGLEGFDDLRAALDARVDEKKYKPYKEFKARVDALMKIGVLQKSEKRQSLSLKLKGAMHKGPFGLLDKFRNTGEYDRSEFVINTQLKEIPFLQKSQEEFSKKLDKAVGMFMEHF